MTVWHDYVEQATCYITNPDQAAEVRRELRAHLEATAEALQADGLDPADAMAVAVARMGAPACIAMDLGEVHHRHLPWRLYLAPVFLGCIIFTLWHWWSDGRAWEIAPRWLALLGFTLWPDRTQWGRPLRLLRVDLRVKWHWLQVQQWDRALITGAATGGVAGLIWGLLPHWFAHLKDYMVIYPLAAALLTAWVQRRLLPCPALLTAVGATLTFPLAYLPGYFRWWPPVTDWPVMTAYFTILFGLVAPAAGWLAQLVETRGWAVLLARDSLHDRDGR